MIWLVDYFNPHSDSVDCLVIDADSIEEAKVKAIAELKSLQIPKRYILKIEEFI